MLQAHIFNASAVHTMDFAALSDIKILWELNGGVRSIELIWPASKATAFRLYTELLGKRLVITDQYVDMPVAEGWITGVSLASEGVRVIANGIWFRHSDVLYNFDDTAQDTNQGTLSYLSQDTQVGSVSYTTEGAVLTLTDSGQNFADWQTTSGYAVYRVEVTNTDGSKNWAHLGAAVSATEIRVYSDQALTTTGWSSSISGKTPSLYTVYVNGGFYDSGQNFGDWEPPAGGPAAYEIWITNTDDTVTWGFMGIDVMGAIVAIYMDYDLTIRGFLGIDPFGKTPSSYEIILCYDYKTTSEIVKDALLSVPYMESGTFVDESNTIIGFYEPPIDQGGMYPAEIIDKLASMSDSSNRQWNYWATSGGLSLGRVGDSLPHFSAQKSNGEYDWAIQSWMMKSGSVTMERNIQELRNSIGVIYSDIEDNGTTALYPGDGSRIEDSASQSLYWEREAIVNAGNADEEIAESYGELYISKYAGSMFANSFTLSSPYMLDDAGVRWPLWAPIKFGRSYFRFMDFIPTYASQAKSFDRVYVSQAMTMEYSSSTNELRVVLDTEDNALDAIISRMDAFG
jgi:hypothetical protein